MLEREFRVVGDLKASDKVMNDTFWIGVFPGLSEDHIGYMIDRFRDFFRSAA